MSTAEADKEVDERELIARLLSERLETHDNSRKVAQEKIHEICDGLKRQIDELEDKINKGIEEVFNKEDNRIQNALNDLRENDVNNNEISKVIQKSKS